MLLGETPSSYYVSIFAPRYENSRITEYYMYMVAYVAYMVRGSLYLRKVVFCIKTFIRVKQISKRDATYLDTWYSGLVCGSIQLFIVRHRYELYSCHILKCHFQQ